MLTCAETKPLALRSFRVEQFVRCHIIFAVTHRDADATDPLRLGDFAVSIPGRFSKRLSFFSSSSHSSAVRRAPSSFSSQER